MGYPFMGYPFMGYPDWDVVPRWGYHWYTTLGNSRTLLSIEYEFSLSNLLSKITLFWTFWHGKGMFQTRGFVWKVGKFSVFSFIRIDEQAFADHTCQVSNVYKADLCRPAKFQAYIKQAGVDQPSFICIKIIPLCTLANFKCIQSRLVQTCQNSSEYKAVCADQPSFMCIQSILVQTSQGSCVYKAYLCRPAKFHVNTKHTTY
jgi:hypothetical protein